MFNASLHNCYHTCLSVDTHWCKAYGITCVISLVSLDTCVNHTSHYRAAARFNHECSLTITSWISLGFPNTTIARSDSMSMVTTMVECSMEMIFAFGVNPNCYISRLNFPHNIGWAQLPCGMKISQLLLALITYVLLHSHTSCTHTHTNSLTVNSATLSHLRSASSWTDSRFSGPLRTERLTKLSFFSQVLPSLVSPPCGRTLLAFEP